MQNKRKNKKSIKILIGLLLSGIWIYPFYLIVANSFKTKAEIFSNTVNLPSSLDFANYTEAATRLDFMETAGNSIIITIAANLVVVVASAMAAYALSRNTSKLSTLMYFFVAIGLLVPFQGIMIPLVSIFGKIDMLNRFGLVFMYLGLATSMAIFLYFGALRGIPKSLDEAALIDGASTWKIFWKVIFPLLKPTTMTIIVLNSLWFWNDYLLPSLVINKKGMYTIPLKMFYFFGEFNKQWHLALAALAIVILPIIILFVVLQKHVVKGIAEGAVK